MLKNKLFVRVKAILTPLALPAVIYAENLIGKGFGDAKKQIAIDFILEKLPLFLLPFKNIIKTVFLEIFDFAVESAVKKLHSIQQTFSNNPLN